MNYYNKNTFIDPEEKELRLQLLAESLASQCYISPTKEVQYPPTALSFGTHLFGDQEYPVTMGTYGNFSFIQGPPKTKKTFLASLMTAAFLTDGESEYIGKMRGHRDNKKCLHFDTEQGDFHASRVFNRVIKMSNANTDSYKTYALRPITPEERIAVIDYVLNMEQNVGLLVIDGVADLLNDVNNIEESNKLVQKLMYWSKTFDCHLLTIIHSNWGSDKPTGHLGSALEKKAETQIQLKKNEEDDRMINVHCRNSRGKSFEDFSFYVDRVGLPRVASENIEAYDTRIRNTD